MNPSTTLVVCNFVHPHYGQIAFLRRKIRAPHIVFYGDEKWGQCDGVVTYNQSEHEAGLGTHEGGFFAYRSLMDAVQRFPGYETYVFIMDDVWLKWRAFWALPSGPAYLSFHHHRSADLSAPDELDNSPYWWWHRFGPRRARAAHAHFSALMRANLARMTGSEHRILWTPNDLVVLPGSCVSLFLEVFRILSREHVFTEIALPTGLAATGAPLVELGVDYLWKNDRRLAVSLAHAIKARLGIHPVKLSTWRGRLLYAALSAIYP